MLLPSGKLPWSNSTVTEQHPDPLRAVTLVGSQPDGRRQVYIDKKLSAQLTRTEFRVQLLAASVFGALADPPLLNRRAARRSVPRAPRKAGGRRECGQVARRPRPQFYRW